MADHEASRIDKTNHLLLDQPLVRLPYELLRKNFRSAHFVVEKDSQAIKNTLRETAESAIASRSSSDDVLRSVDAMVARLRGVKRKLTAAADDEARLYRQVEARAAHLAELASMQTLDDVKYEGWSRRRLDRLLVDYLLRRGYNATAAALADDKNMRDLVDVETFVAMSRVQESLRAGSVTEALAWCSENKKELRKMDSKLEFMLRYQQYIELVRTQSEPKIMDAIAHAKKYLIPFRDVYPIEFGQAAALLAFDPSLSDGAAYREIWTADRWAMLADLFTRTHHQLLALPAFPLLHIALSSGLSALKTPACHSAAHRQEPALEDQDALNGGGGVGGGGGAAGAPSVCPICSAELNELARGVPYAHHSKSHVEHDLLLLPNGRVYGKQRLDDHARKAGLAPGFVKDLRTGDVYSSDKLKKVYIT